jgi:hypothetical protein
MYRREFCASIGVGVVGSEFRRNRPTPPGVSTRRTYDGLPVTDLTTAHDEGFTLVGRTAGSEGLRVAVTDTTGRIRASRRLTPPEGIDEFQGVPAVTRTADGYAVSSGGWVGMLAPDLTVEAKTAHPEWNGLGNTELLAVGPGVVVAHEHNAPNHLSVTVTGYDAEGNHRWHRHYGSDQSRAFGFLVPDANGVIGGGVNLATGGLWTAGLTPDGGQRWSSTNTAVATENDPAAVFDDGLTVFDGTTMTRLDESRSVAWERSYDSFGDRPPRLVSLPDGGALAGTGTTVGAFESDGRLRWVREYEVPDSESLGGLLILRNGEYVAAGSGPAAESGWLFRLSSSVTPTTSLTSSLTTTETQTVTTDTRTQTTDGPVSETAITIPRFGPVAAFATLAGVIVWLRRRADS